MTKGRKSGALTPIKGGKDGVRAQIEGAKPAEASAPAAEGEQRGPFRMTSSGLFRRQGDDKPDIRVSGPFDVITETRDEEGGGWGLLLAWKDRDGQAHEEAIARRLFAGENAAELRTLLADGGLYLNPHPAARQALVEYLSSAASPQRARLVHRSGWHQIAGNRIFVLPDQVFGVPAERIVLKIASRERAPFNVSGTLQDWRAQVAEPCVFNTRLVFAVSCGFAGPLMELAGEEGGGFNFRGSSRTGKTTALKVAASVWGGEGQLGAGSFIRQWRATSNAAEGAAAVHSDTLLLLDELGQADARELGDTAYMLSAGRGRSRSDRSGDLKATARFRVLFVSTGEIGLAEKIAEAGKVVKAGQEVRFVDIPADAGAGLGAFEKLPEDIDSAHVFADALGDATRRLYGSPARAFMVALLDKLKRNPDFASELRARVGELTKQFIVAYPDAGGQVRSVARRFALVGAAGELATEWLITGWARSEAPDAARACFAAWMASRGTAGAREDAQAIAQLRAFIVREAASRCAVWLDSAADPNAQEQEPPVPAERFRPVKQIGWRRLEPVEGGRLVWHYYLNPEAMREALIGLDFRAALAVLASRGFLAVGQDGKSSRSLTPPGHAKTRLYQVLPGILDAADGDD
jgi:uncharacterized protein (DUF927 family)